jgi:predicted acyl esterase
VDTTASGGIALLTNGLEGLLGIPPTDWLPSVSRYDAGVWMTDRYPDGVRVRGIPRLHLTLADARPTGTIVAYLYDVDWTGTGRLLTHAPYTWLSRPSAIDLNLQVTAFDLAPGHQLALVVDTKDALYFDANGQGGTVTFRDSSWLDLPTA